MSSLMERAMGMTPGSLWDWGINQRVGAHEIDCEMILEGAHLLEVGVR